MRNNLPAFPVKGLCPGLSKRELLAAMAMQGIVTALQSGIKPVDVPLLARDAVHIADALLATLNEKPESDGIAAEART